MCLTVIRNVFLEAFTARPTACLGGDGSCSFPLDLVPCRSNGFRELCQAHYGADITLEVPAALTLLPPQSCGGAAAGAVLE